MGYHIIMDSVGDRTKELMENDNFSLVPLKLIIDEEEFVDDDTLNQQMILDKIAFSKDVPRSSCPSPQAFKDLFDKNKDDDIYVIAGSTNLTGSYNSAKIGERMFLEENPKAKIRIFDSKTGCAGQTLLVYKIIEFQALYDDFATVCKKVEEFISEQETIFALEDLTFLLRNGRLTGLKAVLATALNIVPILNTDDEGVIMQLDRARGVKRALKKLKEIVIKDIKEKNKKTVVISHCSALERAEQFEKELRDALIDIDVKLVDTGGIATLYAGKGGIVISY